MIKKKVNINVVKSKRRKKGGRWGGKTFDERGLLIECVLLQVYDDFVGHVKDL